MIAKRFCCNLTLRDRRLKGRYRTRVGASIEACAVQKAPIARKAAGGTEASGRARDRRGEPDADGTAAGSVGRNDQAQRPVAADGWRATPSGRDARAASGVKPSAADAPRATVAGNRTADGIGDINKRICSPLTRLTISESRRPLGLSKSVCFSFPRGSTVGPVPATDSGQAHTEPPAI